MQGIIEKIQHKNKNKSYGFVLANGEHFYFRLGEVELKEGDPVIFKRGKNEKGNLALDVRLADGLSFTS